MYNIEKEQSDGSTHSQKHKFKPPSSHAIVLPWTVIPLQPRGISAPSREEQQAEMGLI